MYQQKQYFPLLLVLIIALLLFFTRCVQPERPTNLEPTLTIDSISSVSRTSATVNISIRNHGTTGLDSIFICLERVDNTAATIGRIKIDTPTGVSSVNITGLTAGTPYNCYIMGKTATATLRSEGMQFTTHPNEPPKISNLNILSYGPTGAQFEVEIIDDGGDSIDLLEFSCRNNRTGSTTTYRVENPQFDDMHRFRININKLSPDTKYTFSYFAQNRTGATPGTPLDFETGNVFMLKEAGGFAAMVDGSDMSAITKIPINGPIDGRDIAAMLWLLHSPANNYNSAEVAPPNLIEELDLSECNIATGDHTYDGQHFTVDNEITIGMFANSPQLRSIKLPHSATHIRRDALQGSMVLERIEIGANTQSVEVSQQCPALTRIEVAMGNSWYRSVDGVLFNSDATSVIWIPLGKTDPLHLPESITAIGDLAFYNSKITTFYLPEGFKSLGKYAFAKSAITEFTVPDKVVSIPEGVFQKCTSLSTVTLGKGVEYIGALAFDGSGVTDLYVTADTPPVVISTAFGSGSGEITSRCTLHVPAAAKAIYRNHAQWGKFYRIVSI